MTLSPLPTGRSRIGRFRRHGRRPPVPGPLGHRKSRPSGHRDDRFWSGHDVRRTGRRGEPHLPALSQPGHQTGRPRRLLSGEPHRVPGRDLGGPLRRALLHGYLVSANRRRDCLHRQRLWGPGLRDLALQGRRSGRDRRRHTWSQGPLRTRWRHRRLCLLRGGGGCPACRAASRPDRRRGHALLLGHHGPAQGRQAPNVRQSVRCIRLDHHDGRSALRGHDRFGVSVTSTPLPRCSAAFLPWSSSHGLHDRGYGAVRCRAGPGRHPGPRRHLEPMGADHVRQDVEAP